MINKVILLGHIGKDPEVRTLESGNKVANFSLATSEKYKKDGEIVTNTEWHNIVLWEGLADTAENYLKKGDKIYLEGKIKTRSYKRDGEKKYITEIYGDRLVMLGGKGVEHDQGVGEDDMPF